MCAVLGLTSPSVRLTATPNTRLNTGCIVKCTVQSSQCTTWTEHTAQVWRRDAHRSGTCSVIKPTGPPSADDIWGINLTRPVSSQIYSAMLLGRLSCYHTDCGLLVIGFPIPWLDHFHREGGCIFSWMVTKWAKIQTSSQYWIHYKRERLFGINNTYQMLGVPNVNVLLICQPIQNQNCNVINLYGLDETEL